jgi:hypothetical protein
MTKGPPSHPKPDGLHPPRLTAIQLGTLLAASRLALPGEPIAREQLAAIMGISRRMCAGRIDSLRMIRCWPYRDYPRGPCNAANRALKSRQWERAIASAGQASPAIQAAAQTEARTRTWKRIQLQAAYQARKLQRAAARRRAIAHVLIHGHAAQVPS